MGRENFSLKDIYPIEATRRPEALSMSICRIELLRHGAGDHRDIVDPTLRQRGLDQCMSGVRRTVPMGQNRLENTLVMQHFL